MMGMRHLTLGCFLLGSALINACSASDGQGTPSGDEPSSGSAGSDGAGSSGASGSAGSASTGSGGASISANGGSMNIGAGGAGVVGPGGSTGGGGAVLPSCSAPSAATGTTPTLTPGQWTKITPPGICAGAHFGCMDMHVLPCSPSTLYLTTDVEGMWKSTDAGATWKKIGNLPEPVSPGVMEIDPKNPKSMYYIGGVRGASLGFWVSSDGGDTWTEPAGFTVKANNSVGGWVNDLYDVKADPPDFKHVLPTFHSRWEV